MNSFKYRILIIADFNADPLARYLLSQPFSPGFEVATAPYGQVMQILMDHQHELWNDHYDILFIWTRPQSVSVEFNHLLNFEQASTKVILDEVNHFAQVIAKLEKKAGSFFLPSWLLPRFRFSPAFQDFKSNGLSSILAKMNLALSESLEDMPSFYMLDSSRWIEATGAESFNPKLWYLGKCWFGNPVSKMIANDIHSLMSGLRGNARKMIVLDLDNTLWGGIVGDDGWESLSIGGHDAGGEAYYDFQSALKTLANRGILLGIVSKNEESIALEAINKHPSMLLRKNDFSGWRINWNDKAQNIIELANEMNLGLQSIVFIDDNPVERARVRQALPEVLVPEWPEDVSYYVRALWELNCFQVPGVSNEDVNRQKMIMEEQDRKFLLNNIASVDVWIKSLGIACEVEPACPSNFQRVVQLLNKTNQMNLTTRRLTEAELKAWLTSGDRCILTVRVKDIYGDYGLTGIIGLECTGSDLILTDFILSCRVMGRKIEETMLYLASEYGRSRGAKRLVARYIKTDKNAPCIQFFNKAGLMMENEAGYLFELDQALAKPDNITLNWNNR